MGYLIGFIAGVLVKILYDVSSKPIWYFLKIKYLKMSIKIHIKLLKEYKESSEIDKIYSRLVELFFIFVHNIARPVSIVFLFSESKPSTQKELDDYELKIKADLAPYSKLYQNIRIYNEGVITMTELIKRID